MKDFFDDCKYQTTALTPRLQLKKDGPMWIWEPTPPEKQTWGWFNYVSYWVSDCFNINTWMIGGSFIEIGMSWWQALICVAIGYSVCAVILVLNGFAGAKYHIGFPVQSRSSFGMYGSYIPIINRSLMACVWYGVQAWIGGQCVFQMLRAIAPGIVNIPNQLPANTGATSKDFIGFVVFWLVSLLFIYPPVEKIRHLFTLKCILLPIAGLALFIWSIVDAHGMGPIISQPATFTSTSQATWSMVLGITSSMGNMAALVVNTPDFTRYAKKPSDIVWSQLLTMPIGFLITSFMGIVVASGSKVIYGTVLWSPLDLLAQLDNRAAVFFIAFAFALATLGTNLCANSIPAGADLSALFPRFINIRRGGYICALIGLCICPWKLLADAGGFLNFLSAYSVFLGPIAGIMVCDYLLIQKQHLVVAELYKTQGLYTYSHGWNWRAYAAYIEGMIPNLPGFAGALGASVPVGATRVYGFAWILGFLVAVAIHYGLSTIFPPSAATDRPGTETVDEIVYAEYKGDDLEHASKSST
ncbi:hypothetical protein BZG36_03059 [Bifiguratus adelaidae]|uniref:Uracil permease n=1 Tax=Bifiguratus adelaidae TaxID=1938954 RepID=A0A261XZK8_9FUNG|nr:hypothetical protein BZG36_03059 [Bifiguratus adelaidae]